MFSKRDTNLVPARRITAVKRCARLSHVFLALVMQGAGAAAPAKVDLNAFDALKKSLPLPNGESLAYVPMGDPAGPAVVLIHGYTDSARDWVPLVPYLSPRLRLILVDLRGHGRSGKPECCYTRLDFAYTTSNCCSMRSVCSRRTLSGIPWEASLRRPSPSSGRNARDA